ncbi:MAG: hypothetical protein R6V40_03525 [Candidatus Moraniibacteriota bacterium]
MSNNSFEKFKQKTINFWKNNEERILFTLAIILIAVVCFQAGVTKEKTRKTEQIKVSLNNIEASNPKQEKAMALGEAAQRKGVSENIENANKKQENKECQLVGSKNSDKYHSSTCTWAEKIKPGNRVCFSSEEEAKNQGYQPAGCCFKN